MFERFAADARATVTEAQVRARDLGAERIDGTHLLLAIAAGTGPAATALTDGGVTPERLAARCGGADHLDGDALAAIGIDLDRIRAQADHTFGTGALDRAVRRSPRHLPFDREAKKTLEIALREAIRLGDRAIDSGHLLLAVLRLKDGAAHDLLLRAGGDPAQLRAALEARPAA
ncbi:Clp protease N-terminal domain-containing protein [Cellulomonas denverensis]|uniref:Clp protease N-terminal domain-containing protein n=1 Tax=Cellulomonas denverensis TaxID=264297 RepID=UPI0035EDAC1A